MNRALIVMCIVALVAVSAYAGPVTVTVKNGAVEKQVEVNGDTGTVGDIIFDFKQQSGVKNNNLKLHYASGKEIDDAHMVKETQIKNGDILTLS